MSLRETRGLLGLGASVGSTALSMALNLQAVAEGRMMLTPNFQTSPLPPPPGLDVDDLGP